MCVVSMVEDYGIKKWPDWIPQDLQPVGPSIYPLPDPRVAELEKRVRELEELMRLAAEYDKRNGEPSCDSKAKRQKLQELADEYGITIEFPE